MHFPPYTVIFVYSINLSNFDLLVICLFLIPLQTSSFLLIEVFKISYIWKNLTFFFQISKNLNKKVYIYIVIEEENDAEKYIIYMLSSFLPWPLPFMQSHGLGATPVDHSLIDI